MANKARKDAKLAEAKKKCHLNDNTIRMGK